MPAGVPPRRSRRKARKWLEFAQIDAFTHLYGRLDDRVATAAAAAATLSSNRPYRWVNASICANSNHFLAFRRDLRGGTPAGMGPGGPKGFSQSHSRDRSPQARWPAG